MSEDHPMHTEIHDEYCFESGRLLATPGALDALTRSKQTPLEFLMRHLRGDWGQVCTDDAHANQTALVTGARLLSAYETDAGIRIWLITEAQDASGQRPCTTILLPHEY